MVPTLSTPRLMLQPASVHDADDLWALWSNAQVRRFVWDGARVTRAQTVKSIAAHAAEPGLGLWVVRAVAGDAPAVMVGSAGLMRCDAAAAFEPRLAHEIEALVALWPHAWRRGYAQEALRAALGYAFSERGAAQVVAVADAPNANSRRLIERLGFELLSEVPGPKHKLRNYRLLRERFEALATVVAQTQSTAPHRSAWT